MWDLVEGMQARESDELITMLIFHAEAERTGQQEAQRRPRNEQDTTPNRLWLHWNAYRQTQHCELSDSEAAEKENVGSDESTRASVRRGRASPPAISAAIPAKSTSWDNQTPSASATLARKRRCGGRRRVSGRQNKKVSVEGRGGRKVRACSRSAYNAMSCPAIQ
jgi:hypothetical protein